MDQASPARTMAELAAEIAALKRLERMAAACVMPGSTPSG